MMSRDCLADQLESGEILQPAVSLNLPCAEDRLFLLQQRTAKQRKHLCFDPHTRQIAGLLTADAATYQRLVSIFSQFSHDICSWLAQILPQYQGGLDLDRVTYRPEEEATRQLRSNARNDLLHIDAFPTRPARGRRLLRVFANLNPAEPRIWATSEPLRQLVHRFPDGPKSTRGLLQEWGEGVLEMLRPVEQRRAPSDWGLLRLHDFLKSNQEFQQRTVRRIWRFEPGAVWLAMTDTCTYAELRGSQVMEHSFFVRPEVLARAEIAPERLIAA